MSRRTGQYGYIEASGKWWVVRRWMDVPGQEARRHMRARICPISGPGSLSKSERERRAREIVAESGADSRGDDGIGTVEEAKGTDDLHPLRGSGSEKGLRIGEVLGIEIDKHISTDFLTLYIKQKVRHGKVEQWLKTANSIRQVDLHPAIARLLKQYVGEDRKTGFLFCTRKGDPVSPTNIIRRHLHKALKELNT